MLITLFESDKSNFKTNVIELLSEVLNDDFTEELKL